MEIVETSIFTRQVTDILDDQEYNLLQLALIQRPDLGDIIPDTNGLRKVRWKVEGRGKRGGIRVIYYWFVSDDVLYMLYLYPKNVQDDLTPKQKRILSKIVEEELK